VPGIKFEAYLASKGRFDT